MFISSKTFMLLALLFASSTVLTACGNVSQNVAKDGRSAQDLVWPKLADTSSMHQGGTFPNRDNLIRVHAGLNKQQIGDLVGYPHFSEGVWGVREWTYVFNFREPVNSTHVVVCQFKVLFDDHKIAQSFYWSPAKLTFSADALFAFDRSSLADITDSGRAQLGMLAQSLKERAGQIQTIRVTGYTDRLGSDAYNDRLSTKRADTVKGYLASQGVDPLIITTHGLGKQNPLKECVDAGRDELVACLAPNRRVEILVMSSRAMQKAD